jgi:hypothetical protein
MALIFVCKAGQGSTIGQADPALRPLQSFSWTQSTSASSGGFKYNHISRFAAELRISAHTPTLPTSQTRWCLRMTRQT